MESKILTLFPDLDKNNEDYVRFLDERYCDFINLSELPDSAKYNSNYELVDHHLIRINDRFKDLVDNRCEILLIFKSYNSVELVVSKWLDTYYKQCVSTDSLVENILYVDTNILLQDYKRLMDFSDDKESQNPVYSTTTLFKTIENAPLVIWNRLTLIRSEYDRNKFYDLLLVRRRKNLANFFIITGSTKELSGFVTKEIADLMNNGLELQIDIKASPFIQLKKEES